MTIAGAHESLEQAAAALPDGLREHVLRVVEEAQRLSKLHGVDTERATIAALGHDLARALPARELLQLASEAGIAPSAEEAREPVLLHGALSAWLMAERHGVTDDGALAAARHHTTGRAGMSDLELLIYVADKIEPEKANADAALLEARALAERELRDAARRLLDRQIVRAVQQGWPLHRDTVEARNYLLS